jgi:NAD(P)-dependent dehydrogenase (short-subunit alcohol dehydrogenase family)
LYEENAVQNCPEAMGRWQTAPEFAALAVFLASAHARSITGQTIDIDGGQVMHA